MGVLAFEAFDLGLDIGMRSVAVIALPLIVMAFVMPDDGLGLKGVGSFIAFAVCGAISFFAIPLLIELGERVDQGVPLRELLLSAFFALLITGKSSSAYGGTLAGIALWIVLRGFPLELVKLNI